MAHRPYFVVDYKPPFVIEKNIEFKYEAGFALSQKQKSVRNLHASIKQKEKGRDVLEVSTKSEDSLGVMLSAFNLYYKGTHFKLENVFQSSKVFMLESERKGPFRELLSLNPSEAKKHNLLHNSGRLCCFIDMDGKEWALEPKTAYYDWLYITSLESFLNKNENMYNSLMSYSVFTDIEFVPEKSINCQARALAMYVGMQHSGEGKYYLSDKDVFLSAYKTDISYSTLCEQLSMF